MTEPVQALLDAFDRLPDAQKREAIEALLRRAASPEKRGPVGDASSDEDLERVAESLFLNLDSHEDDD